MLLADVTAYERNRLRSPWIWGLMLALLVIIALGAMTLILATSARHGYRLFFATVFWHLSIAALYIWFSPAPWFWTGTRASHAPLLRGALQAFIFNFTYLLLVSLIHVILVWGIPGEPAGGRAVLVADLGLDLLFHSTAAGVLGYFITIHERTRIIKEETEKRLREAHWVLLRGQLSPHVLFNALNGLAELVHLDAHAAEKGILDLGALYRSLLDHGSRPLAPLRDERILVERFLTVEEMRLGARISIQWRWDESLDDLETPPFLIQPLVENAIKHGIAPCPLGGRLCVGLVREGNQVVIQVENTGQGLPLILGSGVGIGNLEARLFLSYGNRASFKLCSLGEVTLAEIRIDMEG